MQTRKRVVLWGNPLIPPRAAVLRVILITGMLGSWSVARAGTSCYLDPVNGNDSYDGTAATYEGGVRGPWATMKYAGDHAANGSTVYCRSGNYGFVTLTRTGMGRTRDADAVTFAAQPGEKPVLKGLTVQGPGDLYWVFDGLAVTVPDDGVIRAGITIGNAHHVTVRNCAITGVFKALMSEGMSWYIVRLRDTCGSIVIQDCTLTNGYFGYAVDGAIDEPVTLHGCTIYHVSGPNIQWDPGNDGCARFICEDNVCYDQVPAEITPGNWTHGTGIALWHDNCLIQRNVIRNCGNTAGIRTYPDTNTVPAGGYSNITIQNNLIYDTRNNAQLQLHTLGTNIKVLNNTIIGIWRNYATEWTGMVSARYCGGVGFGLAAGSSWSNITFKGNVIADEFDGPATDSGLNEDYNIFYAWNLGPPTYSRIQTPIGPHSKIISWGSSLLPGYGKDYFEKSGVFFVGGPLFDQYTARFVADATGAIHPHGQDLTDAYQLASSSLGIGFCAGSPLVPADDFTGRPRDAAPDVGCYEFAAGMANYGPVLTPIGSRQAQVGVELTIDVNATDPNQDPLVYSMSDLPGASISADTGMFRWTPTADQIGVHQVTFTVSDGQTEASEVVTITVQRSNTAPVLYPIGDRTVSVNELLSFSLSATDADGDPITFTATGLPNGAGLVGPTFTWTPSDTQAGTYDVSFVASDGYVQTSQAVTITVTPIDHPPVLAAIGDKAVDESGTLTFAVSATDPDGDALAYTATGLPAGADFTGQTFTWTPGAGQAGTYEVTFVARAGNLSDSETINIIVAGVAPDTAAPVVAQLSPAADAIQVPLNNLVTLHITDAGTGVDPNSVTIAVEGSTVYQGNQDTFTSPYGQCTRSGTRNDYHFIFQDNRMFDFDHTVTVRVRAADRAGNAMDEYVYSFVTEMRSFSSNKQVSKTAGSSNKRGPATARDAAGNIWAAWQAGAEGARDIYVARLAAGAEDFGTPIRLTNDSRDQCNPDMAVGPDGSAYVVWQDNRSGNWDIYVSIGSVDKFSREVQVTNSDKNETNPSIAVDGQSPAGVWVAWQDDRDGNQEIYVAGSSNAFASSTAARVTTEAAPQTQPDITVDAQNTVYIFWTDQRNGQADIYGAASSSGPWTNVPVVAGTADQTDPAVVAQPGSSVLHLVWMDSTSGNQDIYYAKLDGLPASPVTGSSIIDDTSGADQVAPAVVCNEAPEVFACWQDFRHAGATGTDSDLYFAELSEGTVKTNVFVGDDGTSANQGEPALGVDAWGQPYIVWSDDRNTAAEIYFAATTFIDPSPLDAETVTPAAEATIGTPPAEIDAPEDVSILVPVHACQASVRVTISKVINPRVSPLACLGSYDFGPSGISFDQPVTVTIPYRISGTGRAKPYWYDSLTGALSQQGITNVETIVIASNLNALRFQTTHFTAFYVVASETDTTTTDGGFISLSGGCSLSPTGAGSPAELLVPYAIIAIVTIILRYKDRKKLQNSELGKY
jgi:hypothetical protein